MKELINVKLTTSEQMKIQDVIYFIMKERNLEIPKEESFIIDNSYFEMLSVIEGFIKISHNIALKENDF